jgi:hypothetical protein
MKNGERPYDKLDVAVLCALIAIFVATVLIAVVW